MKFNATIAGDDEEAEGDEEAKTEEQNVKVDVQVLRVNEEKCAVKFTYRNAETKRDVKGNSTVNHFLSISNCDGLKNYNDATFEEH